MFRTRAESRMHWKDTSIDEDGEKTEEEHGHGHGRALSGQSGERGLEQGLMGYLVTLKETKW